MRNRKRWALILVAIALPLVLLWVIVERNSWRPRVLHTNHQVLSLTFSPDGTQLAFDGPSITQILDVRSKQILKSCKNWVLGEMFFLNKNKIVTYLVGTTWLWNFGDNQSPKPIVEFKWDKNLGRRSEFVHMVSLRLLADGATLAYTGLNSGSPMPCKMLLYDASSGELQRKLEFALPVSRNIKSYRINCLECSPDGSMIAAGFGVSVTDRNSRAGQRLLSGEVWVWDNKGRLKYRLLGHSRQVSMVAFASQGKLLATACSHNIDNRVRIWDLRTGKLLHVLPPQLKGIYEIAFAPDGRTLLTVSGGLKTATDVRLWDTRSGNLVRTVLRQESAIHAIAFSPDGSDLAVSSTDKTIKLFRVK